MKRVAALLGLVPPLVLAVAGTAYADAPTKTGWWNAASANGVALPMPTTSADDLHVGQGANGPTAYAAVAYSLVGQPVSAATLQLKVAANRTVGTIDVVACPTKDATWKGGGDQPYDAAPAYDCAKGIQGAVAADGTAVTFLLDTAQQSLGTGYSLAIVPSADAKPFDVDFVKPDATSLAPQVDATFTEPSTDNAAPPPAAPAPQPPTTGVSGTAPLSAGTVAQLPAPAPALQGPAVAAPVVPAPQPAAAPYVAASATRPAVPVSNKDRYAAGSGLALIAGFLVWALQQSNPEPRLLGGMARKAGPATRVPVDPAPRGIGRFATLRTAPARRLV
jgi:hypothetical protein